MIRFRRLLPLAAVVAAAVILGSPPTARATFTLTLSEGATTQTYTYGGPLAPVEVLTNGGVSIGDYTVVFTVASTNSQSGLTPATLTIENLAVSAFGTPSADLVVTVTDTGFTAPGTGRVMMGSQLATTQLPQGSKVTFQSFLNGSAGTALSLNSVNGATVTDTKTILSTPYTLSNVTDIHLASAGTVQSSGITSVATPAPAGVALALSGLPVLGIGGWLRRRKQA